MGSHQKILVSRDLTIGRFSDKNIAPVVVLIFDNWLALNSVLEIAMTFAQKWLRWGI